MIIGIDIDDTITNSSDIFVKYARKYNKENKIDFIIDKTQLDQTKAFGWNKNQQNEFLNKYLKSILMNTLPNKYVVEIINKLREEGNMIYFITARNESEIKDIFNITNEWLMYHNIKFDKLIINCLSKVNECIENDVDIFIDDNYFNCENVFNAMSIPVFLFNTRYNDKYSHSCIERVYDWNEIYIKINNLKKGVNND